MFGHELEINDQNIFYSILCKSEKRNTKGFSIPKKYNSVKITPVATSTKDINVDESNKNFIVFEAQYNKLGKLINPVKDLYAHIRNAFAHLNIKVEGNNYVMKDEEYYKKDGNKRKKPRLTMYGVIDKDHFKDLINHIENKKQSTNQSPTPTSTSPQNKESGETEE